MRTEKLLQRIITVACVVVGLLVVVGMVSAFFSPGIEAALTLPSRQPPALAPTMGKTPAVGVTRTVGAMQATVTLPPMVVATATQVPVATPNPVGPLAQDAFQRPDQMFWGTATDGQLWSGDAQSSPSFKIVGHTGQINGSGTFNALLGPRSTNEEVVFSGSISRFGPFNMGAVLHWTDANNWYKAYIDGSQLVLLKRAVGVTTLIKAVPFAALAGKQYSLRFRVVGRMLLARVWPTGSAEPTNWLVTAADSTGTALPSGFGGLRLFLVSGAIVTITMFTENVVA
jgi:hypothetical protein